MHCNHGPGTACWEFVDWRPFVSVTHEVTAPRLWQHLGVRDEFDTFDFVPTPDGGTQIVHRVRLKNRSGLSLFAYRIQRQAVAAYWRRSHRHLLRIIAEDNAVGQRRDTAQTAARGLRPH